MKRILLCLFLIVALNSCQKKLPTVVSDQNKPPDEPLQRLAWDSARQIDQSTKSYAVKLGTIENQAQLPDNQLHYFRGALENELWQLKRANDASPVLVNG